MESVTAKLKTKSIVKDSSSFSSLGQPQYHIRSSERGNISFDDHFKGSGPGQKKLMAFNDGSSLRNKLIATPRPPLHRNSVGDSVQNDRLILCKRCGSLSSNMSSNCCQGGKDSKFALSPSISIGRAGGAKRLPETPVKTNKYQITANIEQQQQQASENYQKLINDIKKPSPLRKKPDLLVLSSDDEIPETSVAPRLKKAAQRELAMAAVAHGRKDRSPIKDELRNDLLQVTEFDISSTYEPYMCIKCKKVHLGSYKTVPKERILFMGGGIRFAVSHPTSSQESVTIALPTKHLLRIFWHSDDDISFLVFYVKEKLALHIRRQLGMHNQSEFYFDPCSEVDSEKKLIIFGDLNEDILNQLNVFYNRPTNPKMFQKINQDVKSFLASVTSEGHSETSGRMSPTDPNIICNFSPPGSKGAITLTLDDFLCLEEGEFLNDVIIDFYLRYLVFKKLEPSVAARTHVFSTFFYKRLTAKCNGGKDKSLSRMTRMERRHNRVQNWTKGVDIFDKDFLIIPINKKWHWFLAIICFPNLAQPLRIRDGARLPWKPVRKRRKEKNVENIINLSKEESDRDETSSESSGDSSGETDFDYDEPIKQPCIIIFDSLKGPTLRTKVVATLRDYIFMEHWKRKGYRKDFSKTMRGLYPDVPQQPNFYDCGVYILHYAESFFKRPLIDYSSTLTLEEWFSPDEVTSKREEITHLIKYLRKEQFPNTFFEFPHLLTRDEMEEYELFPSYDPRSPAAIMNREEDSEDEQSSAEGSTLKDKLGWMDSFKNSFSILKNHIYMDGDSAAKKPRLDSDDNFSDS